jgi:DNA adenine methylase
MASLNQPSLLYEESFNHLAPIIVRPFLKWAGGKTQLLKQMLRHFPQGLFDKRFDRYLEPFLGGGAVFFFVAEQNWFQEYYLWDLNEELFVTYQVVKTQVNLLIEVLENFQNQYQNRASQQEKSQYFYQVRTDFNAQRDYFDFSHLNESWIRRAAQVIFLNKTCFNGLFRVNGQGYFNVPFGDYKNPTICDVKNLILASHLLQKAIIQRGDFSQCREFATERSFVYFDPPYRPLSKTSNFTSYSHQSFDDFEQIRLAGLCRELGAKGVKWMVSNSDPQNINSNDNFFEVLYQGFNIHHLDATRAINANGQKRGKIKELLITNYG